MGKDIKTAFKPEEGFKLLLRYFKEHLTISHIQALLKVLNNLS
jgi:hypothetical protein